MTEDDELKQHCAWCKGRVRGVPVKNASGVTPAWGNILPGVMVFIASRRVSDQPTPRGVAQHQLLARFCPTCAPVVSDRLLEMGFILKVHAP